MKRWFFVIVFVFSPFVYGELICKLSWDSFSGTYYRKRHVDRIPKNEFPLSVCVNFSDFERHEISDIAIAINTWNTFHKEYVRKRKGKYKGFVEGDLFESTESACNGDLPIIWLEKDKLDSGTLGKFTFMQRTASEDEVCGFLFCRMVIVYPEQKIQVAPNLPPYVLTNVFLHELGHALGIPHLKEEEDPMMMSFMIDVCKHQTCPPTDKTFDIFYKGKLELIDGGSSGSGSGGGGSFGGVSFGGIQLM